MTKARRVAAARRQKLFKVRVERDPMLTWHGTVIADNYNQAMIIVSLYMQQEGIKEWRPSLLEEIFNENVLTLTTVEEK
jgi:hypothetical protein